MIDHRHLGVEFNPECASVKIERSWHSQALNCHIIASQQSRLKKIRLTGTSMKDFGEVLYHMQMFILGSDSSEKELVNFQFEFRRREDECSRAGNHFHTSQSVTRCTNSWSFLVYSYQPCPLSKGSLFQQQPPTNVPCS